MKNYLIMLKQGGKIVASREVYCEGTANLDEVAKELYTENNLQGKVLASHESIPPVGDTSGLFGMPAIFHRSYWLH